MKTKPQQVFKAALASSQVANSEAAQEQMVKGATSTTATEPTLEPGKVYSGRVAFVNLGTRILSVSVGQQVISNCIYAAGELASYFGLEERGVPMLGAAVTVLYLGAGTPSIIVGSTGSLHTDIEGGRPSLVGKQNESPGKETAFDPEEEGATSCTVKKGTPPPIDLLPGESVRTTGLGPALSLLYNFAQLSASDCAKVEACVLNDMVRIVDNYFVHHSCGGDELIWTAGGRCNKEEHFTSYLFEAEGKETPEEPLASGAVAEMNYDVEESVENLYSDTGRWRLSEYKGFLGDMVHRWVTTPTEVMSNIMEDAMRAGQYRSWVGSDGTLSIQAAGGVQIEVTQYIVIPTILKAWNQPDFDAEKAMEDLNDEFLKVWGSGPDWKDLKVAVWQLRYYSKYITLFHSLARFHQLAAKQYCEIPTEAEAPERTPVAEDEDRKKACPSADAPVEIDGRAGHAILSMDPGGSIALVSQGSTAAVLSNGSIQLSCPGNLELKAGGVVSIQGKHVSIRGADTVEMMSLFGTLTLKARTLFQALCEAGLLWLKGDAKEGIKADKGPMEDLKSEQVFREYAIVLDAAQGKTLVHGAKGVTVGSTDKEANIMVHALGADSNVDIVSQKNVSIIARAGTIFTQCMTWICRAVDAGFYGARVLKLGSQIAIQKGILHAQLIYSNVTTAYGAFIGRSMFVAQEDNMEPYKPITDTPDLDSEDKKAESDTGERTDNNFRDKELTFDARFKLATWDGIFTTDVEDPTSLKMSFYEVDAEDEAEEYTIASVSDTRLQAAIRTEPSVAYPGYEVRSFRIDDPGIPLGEAWSKQFSPSDIKNIGSMIPMPYTYVFRKK